jgi:cytochrome c oxidase assembly factor 6
MVWLPWSSGDSKDTASDGGRIAPDRTSRARCWEGRDTFFACLDKNDILDGIKEDKKARQKCAKEVAEFEAACSQSWVRTYSDTSDCLIGTWDPVAGLLTRYWSIR